MEFVNFSREEAEYVKKTYHALIERCDTYIHRHPSAKIWIRDTDHTYSSIRLEGNIPMEDYKELVSTCACCGSNQSLSMGDEDFGGIAICDYCRAMKAEYGYGKFYKMMSFLGKIDGEERQSNIETQNAIPNSQYLNNVEKAKRFRVRVLVNKQGLLSRIQRKQELLYLNIDRLRMDEDSRIYIPHGDDKSDIVKFAGIYLNERDKNGHRMFQGDIVKFSCRNFRGEMICEEGVLCEVLSNNHYPNVGEQYPQPTKFYIEDNLNYNFPPPPNAIVNESIEIIGNIFENANYKINGGDEAKYYANCIREVEE